MDRRIFVAAVASAAAIGAVSQAVAQGAGAQSMHPHAVSGRSHHAAFTAPGKRGALRLSARTPCPLGCYLRLAASITRATGRVPRQPKRSCVHAQMAT